VAGGLAGVPLCQGLPYGTILAEVGVRLFWDDGQVM
jgi:hypothetical protein